MLRHPATEISAMVNFVKSHGYEQTLKDSDRFTGRIDDSREQPEHTVPYQSYQSVTSRSFHHVVLMFFSHAKFRQANGTIAVTTYLAPVHGLRHCFC